jgi:phosphate transport system permease protein
MGNTGGASALPVNLCFNTQTNTKGYTLSSPQKPNQNIGALLDKIFKGTTMFFAAFVLLLLVSIIIALFIGSWPALKTFGLPFFASTEWNPVTEEFGALVPIYGTVVTSVIAMCIAVPLSFGIALFITEIAPVWLKRPVGVAVELLAGIPSIIYGMWGLFVFAPLFAEHVQP